MTIVNSESDFDWRKKELDLAVKYECRHSGEPEKYPCRVRSEFWDDPNGPYAYFHHFTYEQEVICECCGAKSLVWPDMEK